MFFVFNLLLNGLLYKICSAAAFEGVNIIFIKKKYVFLYTENLHFFVVDISKKNYINFYTQIIELFLLSVNTYVVIQKNFLFVCVFKIFYLFYRNNQNIFDFFWANCKIFSILDYSV